MYDSIAPVCFDVLTFFNALLIITHWLPLTPTSASGAPFLSSWTTSLTPSMPRLLHPSPAPEPRLGIGLLAFGRWWWWWWWGGIRGADTGLEMKRVTKTYRRAGRAGRCTIIGCSGYQTRLHFFQPSSPSAQLSFPRPGREAGRGIERQREREMREREMREREMRERGRERERGGNQD